MFRFWNHFWFALGIGDPHYVIGKPPLITYAGGEVFDDGDAVSVEYENGAILWDDDSAILWDDGTPILWSYLQDTSPDVFYSFSPPRITYSGDVE